MSSQGSGARDRGWSRRGLVGAGLAGLLGGCGLRPIYARRPDGTAGPAVQGIAAISVAIIPERSGQLLRQALQTRFDRAGTGVAKRYDLVANFGVAAEGLNIDQLTSAPSRLRLVGLGTWSLYTQDTPRKTVTSGVARVLDGLNIFDQQYFAMDMEVEAVERRLAGAVADEITLQLATWFNRQADTG